LTSAAAFTAVTVTPTASNSTTQTITIWLRGWMTLVAGTLIPEIGLTAAPGHAFFISLGSWFRMTSQENNAPSYVGNWS
jgi:hypothetical protein